MSDKVVSEKAKREWAAFTDPESMAAAEMERERMGLTKTGLTLTPYMPVRDKKLVILTAEHELISEAFECLNEKNAMEYLNYIWGIYDMAEKLMKEAE